MDRSVSATAEKAPRIRDARPLILCLFFICSLPLLTPRLYGGDEVQYFAYLRSAWKDGDLQFSNEYKWLYDRSPAKLEPFRRAFMVQPTRTGHTRNDAPIGCAILWTPFFGAADLYARFTSYPADGYSFPYVLAICFASALYGFLGFLLQYLTIKRYFGAKPAFWAVVTLWFGAHAVFYMYVTPPMSHATSIFTTSLFLFSWLRFRDKDSLSRSVLLGLLGGVAAMVRWQDGLFVLLPLLDRKPLKLKVVTLCATLAAFVPQLWVWQILNGEINPYSTGNLNGKFFWYARYLIPVLFSSYHGLFIWTPVALLCITGFVFMIRRDPVLRLPVLVFVLELYLLACLDTWQGGAGFGLRYIISGTAVLTFGLAALYSRWHPRLTPAVSAFFVVWNLFMVIQASTGMIPRAGHFRISVMVRNQFTRVPAKLADVAYRYMFDRSSFYRQDNEQRHGP
jgi:hypothetical protein